MANINDECKELLAKNIEKILDTLQINQNGSVNISFNFCTQKEDYGNSEIIFEEIKYKIEINNGD